MEEKYHLYDQFLSEFTYFLIGERLGVDKKIVTLNAPEWTEEDRFVYFSIINIYRACFGKFDFNLKTKFGIWLKLWLKHKVRIPALARARDRLEIRSNGLLDKFAQKTNKDVYELAREVARAYYGG